MYFLMHASEGSILFQTYVVIIIIITLLQSLASKYSYMYFYIVCN